MAALKRRHNRFEARVRIPTALVPAYGGRTHLYRTITTSDKRAAKAEADIWEAAQRAEWSSRQVGAGGVPTDPLRLFREVYRRTREESIKAACEAAGGDPDAAAAVLDVTLEDVGFAMREIEEEGGTLSPAEKARVAGIQDAIRGLMGHPPTERPELELTFTELAEDYLAWWKAQGGLKSTSNTEQQKRATFRLFASYWKDRPIRAVERKDAARFMDGLRALSPAWGRSPRSKTMDWDELRREFAGGVGQSDATMNRHAATLQSLWQWAEVRGYCSGRNPFDGHHRKLRVGVNVKGYLAWEPDELRALFDPPPKRDDLKELMLVALFSGCRLDEIASLRGSQLREQGGIHFIQVEDAKTPAGNRQVPVHPEIGWVLERARLAGPNGRLWPMFNPEGPGKKPGADAGREFSHFKQRRGFRDRRKVFHSFRKNVTRQMERAGVPENEWAQVFGHEKGFTYGRYNPDGITLERKAQIISIIEYPGLALPHPEPRS